MQKARTPERLAKIIENAKLLLSSLSESRSLRSGRFMGISQRHRERFKKKLVEQLGFLDRSSQLFDTGFEEEAIRIAQTLRVIFHQTNASTSLITHLGFGGKKMLSSSLGGENWMNYLNQRIDLRSSQPVAMIPN